MSRAAHTHILHTSPEQICTHIHTHPHMPTLIHCACRDSRCLIYNVGWLQVVALFHSFTILVVLIRPLCNTMQDAASQFKTLRRTATHCDALRRTATHCDALRRTTRHIDTQQRTALHCNTLQHTPPRHAPLAAVEAASIVTQCNLVQDSATQCNTLQHTATQTTLTHTTCSCWSSVHSNTLQHAARHCNTLQHTQL